MYSKQTAFVIVGALLIGLAGWWMFGSEPGLAQPPLGEARSNRVISGGSSLRLSGQRAKENLQELMRLRPDGVMRFEDVERWVKALSDDELALIADGLDFDDADGYEGWVRSAIFAEWGRRDPGAAQALLQEHPLGQERNFAIEQAWFAVYRGWAETDLEAAYEALLAMGNTSSWPGAAAWKKAREMMFRQFTHRHGVDAWERVQAVGLSDEDALRGYFLGQPPKNLQAALDLWRTQHWVPTKKSEGDTGSLGSRFVVHFSKVDQIAQAGALTMAQHDLGAALAWLEEGPGQYRNHRQVLNVLRLWAKNSPDEAQALLPDYLSQNVDWGVALAQGILAQDASRASTVLSLVPNAAHGEVLLHGVGTGGQPDEESYFPEPHRRNHLPHYVEQYRSLRNGIALADLSEELAQDLKVTLNHEFRERVSEAQEAIERSSPEEP